MPKHKSSWTRAALRNFPFFAPVTITLLLWFSLSQQEGLVEHTRKSFHIQRVLLRTKFFIFPEDTRPALYMDIIYLSIHTYLPIHQTTCLLISLRKCWYSIVKLLVSLKGWPCLLSYYSSWRVISDLLFLPFKIPAEVIFVLTSDSCMYRFSCLPCHSAVCWLAEDPILFESRPNKANKGAKSKRFSNILTG